MKTHFEELYENDKQVKQLSVTQDAKLQKLEMDLDAQARNASMGQLKPMPKPRDIPFFQNTTNIQNNLSIRKSARQEKINLEFQEKFDKRWDDLAKEHPELYDEHEKLKAQEKQKGQDKTGEQEKVEQKDQENAKAQEHEQDKGENRGAKQPADLIQSFKEVERDVTQEQTQEQRRKAILESFQNNMRQSRDRGRDI